IELHDRLAGGDAISKVGEYAIDDPFDLRRDGHFGFGSDRADDFNSAADRFLAYGLGHYQFRRLFSLAALLWCRSGASHREGRYSNKEYDDEAPPGHKAQILVKAPCSILAQRH